MKYPSTILNLIECFKKLPGIGEKTAERLALSMLDNDDSINELFAKSIKEIKTKIKRCNICNNLSEEERPTSAIDVTYDLRRGPEHLTKKI